jgi:hypothetical protein
MNHEYRIAQLEGALNKQRRLIFMLLLAIVAIVCMGTTAVVSEKLTIENRASTPVFVQLVDGMGHRLGSATSPLWTNKRP